jgi:hypothetical protein
VQPSSLAVLRSLEHLGGRVGDALSLSPSLGASTSSIICAM